MPAQPPFLTPTRTPTIGCTAFAITYLMRSAAASVRRIAWGLARDMTISPFSSRRGERPGGGLRDKKKKQFGVWEAHAGGVGRFIGCIRGAHAPPNPAGTPAA